MDVKKRLRKVPDADLRKIRGGAHETNHVPVEFTYGSDGVVPAMLFLVQADREIVLDQGS